MPSLGARLTVGDTTVCPLERDAQSGDFKGSCATKEVGKDIGVELEYTASPAGQTVIVARASTKATIPEQGEVNIAFQASDLTYPDEDGDGIKTVDELCLGMDPTKKDAPALAPTDPVVHEQDAIGSAQGLYIVGERFRVLGSNFPAASFFKVSIGPVIAAAGPLGCR